MKAIIYAITLMVYAIPISTRIYFERPEPASIALDRSLQYNDNPQHTSPGKIQCSGIRIDLNRYERKINTTALIPEEWYYKGHE